MALEGTVFSTSEPAPTTEPEPISWHRMVERVPIQHPDPMFMSWMMQSPALLRLFPRWWLWQFRMVEITRKRGIVCW